MRDNDRHIFPKRPRVTKKDPEIQEVPVIPPNPLNPLIFLDQMGMTTITSY